MAKVLYKFNFFWQGPAAIAGLWYVLDYARLSRFLTRRNCSLAIVFILIGSALILTNDVHHWVWRGFLFDGAVQAQRGTAGWMLIAVGLLLAFLSIPVLLWLFIRSPLHRWPVALILAGKLISRAAYLVDVAAANPVAPLDPIILASNLYAMLLAVALFGFRMFDPIPMARKIMLEQMEDGMLVLDGDGRIVDLNPVAQTFLDATRKETLGREVRQALGEYPALQRLLDDPTITRTEIQGGPLAGTRCASLPWWTRAASASGNFYGCMT